MKNIISVLLLVASTWVQAQIKTPAMSPMASNSQTVGITEISMRYGRPSVRGRVIFGENGLLPYGEVWRTGANAANKFTFSEAVSVGGKMLKKGSYSILCTPGKRHWTVRWYPYSSGNWATYVDQTPVMELLVPVQATERLVETLEIHLQQVSLNGAMLELAWEHTLLQMPLLVHDQDKILESISSTLNGPSNDDYFQAGLYLHESGGDLEQALKYVQKLTRHESALFFQVSREAMILHDLGRNKEALISAKRALALSKKAGNMDFVRLNTKIIEETDQ